MSKVNQSPAMQEQGKRRQKNNINELVLQYRKATRRSERNKIYTAIYQHYKPKLHSILSEFTSEWHNYIYSEYDYYLLQCIDRWDETKGTQFTTYWYTYVALKLRSVVQEKYIYKHNRDRQLRELAISYNYIDNR